jgi:hypothetical protein
VQREGKVRIYIEAKKVRGTHTLQYVEEQITQKTKRNQASKGTYQLSSAEGGTSKVTEIN